MLKGYGNTEDGIIEEANAVLKIVQDYQNQGKDLKPQDNNIIEIGDGK